MLSKEQVVEPLAAARTTEVVVTTMGAVRPWGRISSHPLDFASVDSAMGHAADLALGIALARPERRVICLNGDGSMLMTLGTLATIAQAGAPNLVLIVMQNGTYEITGSQPVPGGVALDFAAMAKACGISRALHFDDPAAYAAAVPSLLDGNGPVFVSLLVEPGSEGPMRRGKSEGLGYLEPSIADSARTLRRTLVIGP
jgi:thiamine pyrophosphate-dependent acetolactate synthase large subunit-like protein